MTSAAAATGAAPPKRLPPGRHGLSREEVRASQRRRLVAAAAESLAEHGYGAITITGVARRAGVSTATFYKRFDDLWDCLLAAYEAGAERLRERIEVECAAAGGREERLRAGVLGALRLAAAEPALCHLLTTEPPSHAAGLWAARRSLIAELSSLLAGCQHDPGGGEREIRLTAGALALVSIRSRAEGGERLEGLAPALTSILAAR